ncbi:FecCD family ABC transporter permease [Actinobacillus pleuropneumoniae]|uniref:Fe(III) dicitrate ABC transporter, permease n=1 Tax=Actinobacillus pleuropneumoniae serotype 5b (strain L20) TaxID=416269 RepID=A3N390_ACTP2|nr:iron ABC transporter permease [Actinobacillus pleuropneumoniae]ABN74876.1 Fe(III) dicitrate ABC transporter, permease [Actinobacillus pleuropneumoniae serovar 5b str. L20]
MSHLTVEKIVQNQRKLERKRWFIVLTFLAISLIGLVFDIVTGPSMLPLDEVVKALLRFEDVETTTNVIVYDLRLPMALMALVVGAALGVGGAEIQTLLNNPMASPYTLGLAAAAGLGASTVIAFGGFGLPSAFAALEISQQILFWLFGSLTKATWENLSIATVVTIVCVSLLAKDLWKLTALRLGEARALSLGINLQRLRLKTLVLVAIMTATAISFVGIIGFIGLVAPHVARMLLGEDQRFFLPGAMLIGAAFLSVASVLSKVIVPGALFPVGIITSFVGVPFFFWIVLTKR